MTDDKGDDFEITQLPPSNETTCVWHAHNQAGKDYEHGEILPDKACPWLYNTLYPYFLGFHFGAKYHYNEAGDCNVGCPAAKGVDTMVRKVANDPSVDPRIEKDWRYLAYAEITAVHGDCPYQHEVGQKILFTTGMPKHFMCPAGFHNIFPLMRLQPPSCIDMARLRCPDYEDVILFDASKVESVKPADCEAEASTEEVQPVP